MLRPGGMPVDQNRTFLRPASDRVGTGGVSDDQWSGFGLPSDMLASARSRLGGFVAFLGVVLVFMTVSVWVSPFDLSKFDRSFVVWSGVAQAVAVLGHALFFEVIRNQRFSHAFVLKLGFVYQSTSMIACSRASSSRSTRSSYPVRHGAPSGVR